jgi:hypothetical protein
MYQLRLLSAELQGNAIIFMNLTVSDPKQKHTGGPGKMPGGTRNN